MTREAEQEAQFWGDKSPRHARGDEAVPLHYLTAAYKRKRVIDNVMDSELRLAYAQSKQNGDARYTSTAMHACTHTDCTHLQCIFLAVRRHTVISVSNQVTACPVQFCWRRVQ